MRIPTKTKMLRNRKDSSPISWESGGSCENSRDSNQLLVPNPMKMRSSPSTSSRSSSTSTSSTTSGQRSSFSSTSAPAISLLRQDLVVEQEFTTIKTLNTGSFSKIVLATLKKDPGSSSVVIKGLHSPVGDFNRQVELTHLLSPHPNVVTCANVTFLWDYFSKGEGALLCFLQEFAPYGSLSQILTSRRSGEAPAKLICSQIASALEFMHHLRLVHGAVTPNHVLVFRSDFSLVKLTDFSQTRPEGSYVVVKECRNWSTFTPPELVELLPQERYAMSWEQDSWQLGILASYLLGAEGGRGLWEMADPLQDTAYRSYVTWLKRKNLKVPEPLRKTTPRFRRLFKRLCEPKVGHRSGVRELRKYLKDPWLLKRSVERSRSNRSTSSSPSGAIIRRINDAKKMEKAQNERNIKESLDNC